MIWKAARQTGFEELAVTAEHSVRVAALPWLLNNRFDPLLVSQARAAEMKLLSADTHDNAYFSPGKRRR